MIIHSFIIFDVCVFDAFMYMYTSLLQEGHSSMYQGLL